MKLSEVTGGAASPRMKLSEVTGGGGGASDGPATTPIPGGSGPLAPMAGSNQPTYAPPAAQKPEQGMKDKIADFVMSQGGRFDPKTGASKLLGDIETAFDAGAGLTPAVGAAAKVGGTAAEKTAGAAADAGAKMMAPTPAARRLMESGVELTPGQIKGGAWKTTEEKMASIPITGDAIRSAYKRSLESWNVATVNQILKPFGEAVDKSVKAGSSLIEHASEKLSSIYDRIHKSINFQADMPFAEGLDKDLAYHAGRMSTGDRPRLQSVVQERITDELFDTVKREVPPKFDAYGLKIADGHTVTELVPKALSGRQLQRIRSDLRTEARSFSRSPSMSERQIGYALEDMNGQIGEHLMRTHPDAAAALRTADSAYAQLVRVEEAAANRVKSDGRFSPADLLGASKRLEGGPRNKSFAQGHAMMQQWGKDANEVISSTVPDSGTAGRAAWDVIAMGAAGGAGGVPGMAGLAATAAPWLPASTRALNRLAMRGSPITESSAAAVGAMPPLGGAP